MPCNQLAKYCVHHSTPKKYMNRFAHCPFLDETPVKLEKESGNCVSNLTGIEGAGNNLISISTTQHTNHSTGSNHFSNGLPEESEKVKEIQKKILTLRDCNELLLTHIKKLFDSSYQCTKEDLDYLQKLYDEDEKNLDDLGKSVSKMKLLPPPPPSYDSLSLCSATGSIGSNHTVSYNCGNLALKQWDDHCNFMQIKEPCLALPGDKCVLMQTSFCQTHRFHHPQQTRCLHGLSSPYLKDLSNSGDGCCRLLSVNHYKKDGKLEKNGDLLRMETELKAIKERVEKLTGEKCEKISKTDAKLLGCSEWSIISGVEEDKFKSKEENGNGTVTISCKKDKCLKSGKCFCKNEKKIKCVIA